MLAKVVKIFYSPFWSIGFLSFCATQKVSCAKRNASARRKTYVAGKIVVLRDAEARNLEKIAFLRRAEGVIFRNLRFCVTRKLKNGQKPGFCVARKRSFFKTLTFAPRGSTSFWAAKVPRGAEGQFWAKTKLLCGAEVPFFQNLTFRVAQKYPFSSSITFSPRRKAVSGVALLPRRAVKIHREYCCNPEKTYLCVRNE